MSVAHPKNYIVTTNPFKLAAPPDWWLQMVYDYDADLVVFPSVHRMAYILARRRRHSSAMAELNALDKSLVRKSAGLDGDVLANHNLIYVRHLIGDTVKRPSILQWLRDADLKARGGADKVSDAIEDIELDITKQKRRNTLDDIDHRARDAWRSYQARTGRRAGHSSNSSGRGKQMPIKGFTPAESPLAIFTGRDL